MNNILILIGRITKELELRSTSNGKYVLDLPIAVQNGKDDTTFITVSTFGNTAEMINKYCHKGDLIGTQCIVKNHNWEDKEGKKHYDYTFLVNKITFLQTKKEDKQNIEIPQNTKSEYDGIKLTDKEIDEVFSQKNDDDLELPF